MQTIKLRKRTAQQIIAEHYGVPLSRVDPETVAEELANVKRKRAKGNQDDGDLRLDATLSIHGHID